MKIIDINGNKRECVRILQDIDWPGYIKAELTSRLGIHIEWYPIKEFIKNNPTLDNLADLAIATPHEDFGVVTNSNKLTLTDQNKNWGKNNFAGIPIWISRGKGEGQVRTVTSNSKTSVTIDKPWNVAPDQSSQYVISQNIHNPKPLGNTLSENGKIKKRRV